MTCTQKLEIRHDAHQQHLLNDTLEVIASGIRQKTIMRYIRILKQSVKQFLFDMI